MIDLDRLREMEGRWLLEPELFALRDAVVDTRSIWWCEAEQFGRLVKPEKPWGVHECSTEFGCGRMALVPITGEGR